MQKKRKTSYLPLRQSYQIWIALALSMDANVFIRLKKSRFGTHHATRFPQDKSSDRFIWVSLNVSFIKGNHVQVFIKCTYYVVRSIITFHSYNCEHDETPLTRKYEVCFQMISAISNRRSHFHI